MEKKLNHAQKIKWLSEVGTLLGFEDSDFTMIILLILISINESFCIFEEERCLEISSILICAKRESFKSINRMEIHCE